MKRDVDPEGVKADQNAKKARSRKTKKEADPEGFKAQETTRKAEERKRKREADPEGFKAQEREPPSGKSSKDTPSQERRVAMALLRGIERSRGDR